VPDNERYLRLAESYIDASSQRKPDGSLKTSLVISPTHAESEKITDAIRSQLAAMGKLGEEREFQAWVPKHLTEAERTQAKSFAEGDMIQFHQHAKGHKSGSRIIVDGNGLPLDQASRFQVFSPTMLSIAAGDRIRITANATINGHRLNNGDIFTVKGFKDGDIVLANNWIVPKEFGQIARGYSQTSHAAQSKTVDTVLIGVSQLSHGAVDKAQMYVSASRARDKAVLFTDDRDALREAVARERERLTATEVFRHRRRPVRERLKRHLSFMRRLIGFEALRKQPSHDRLPPQKEVAHER
jgi:ATP-dependent exoDNAse (exonuclease V) alpha subunit